MSTKIRVWFQGGTRARCVNTSREKVSIRAPGWNDFVVVRPNTTFEGDARDRKFEVIKPALPTADENVAYPVCVSRATGDDIDELLLFVPKIMAETTLLPVSPLKIERLIERCANREGGAIAGIIRGPDGIDASVGLDVCESDVSDHRYMRAIWLGLHPNLRQSPATGEDDSRSHYGRRLFEFARWFHGTLEREAGHPVLLQFDVTTRIDIGDKLGMYERNALPIGASFAYCSSGAFLTHDAEAA